MNSLPLVANRTTASVESREHYNVKARGLSWASAGKSWKVNPDKIVHDVAQSDDVMWDTVMKKSRTHNEYFPRHQSKVNKNWRPWKEDLDRAQYNHLRIPVNHSVSWMAPTFQRRADKEQRAEDVSVLEQKYIQPDEKLLKAACRTQATAIDRTKYTPIDVAVPDMLDVTYVNRQAARHDRSKRHNQHTVVDERMLRDETLDIQRQANLRIKRETRDHTVIDDRLLNDETLDIQRQANLRIKRETRDHTVIDDRLLNDEKMAVQSRVNRRVKHDKFDHKPVLDVRMNENDHAVSVNSNATMPNKKYSNDYDTTSKVQEQMLQTAIQMTGGKNRNDGHHPTVTLDRKASEDVGMFEVRTAIPTFERHTPEFSAIKS